ncbi:nucleoside-binding protein [Proteiniborus ethanoligenes]|uniref:Nucleoside-binding protein n=1 Tax=Proteiniborus ethanoligenes TaxID=415015 RepID=A0A1H3RLV6_9FIRM|nr:BMP family ABC transporter substrate-binding protein [Proteiniborus ethanoligenes]SDZ26712.1 nucleoside-binding protein [Proteiniborus ethanoligenes]
MTKKLLALTLVTVLVLSLAIGCTPKTEQPAQPDQSNEQPGDNQAQPEAPKDDKKFVVGMITDTGGLGDQSFNDSAWAGLKKAESELGVEAKVLESQSADDYGPNLTSFSESGADLVIGVGFLFEESMKAAAEQFPQQKFAVVDTVIDAPNVASLTFANHEGSYLVGVAAGLTTKSNKIGFIGGMKFPLIEEFEYGFRAGVKAVNPNAEVFVQYADSFDDSAKGKEIALAQHQMGADVIYHAAGGVGVGLMQAAEEKGFWAIGVDQDQSALAPEHVLCSAIKRVDTSTFEITKTAKEGTFEGGKVYTFDVSNDGMGYSDNAGNLPEDVKAIMETHKQAIIDGKIVVPKIEAEFTAFEAPQL